MESKLNELFSSLTKDEIELLTKSNINLESDIDDETYKRILSILQGKLEFN